MYNFNKESKVKYHFGVVGLDYQIPKKKVIVKKDNEGFDDTELGFLRIRDPNKNLMPKIVEAI